ncbi:MAG: FkbM family methyltransferase, partial [Pseudomonadota bacterium]|nr:FkbM family methyltransferase [Pseudomonadota bacterium]
YMVARYKPRQVQHTYGRASLNIYLGDPLGETWYDHNWPEPSEIALLRRHKLKPGARCFDLGAHQCVVALMLAREVGPEGLVVAVEANSHNVAIGFKNRSLNQADQLSILHAAIAERSGTMIINEALNSQVSTSPAVRGGHQAEVRSLTIDDLSQEYGTPDVLFIDIEGFECQALRGASETLSQGPDCFVEVHVGEGLEQLGGSVDEILSFFPETVYKLFIAPDLGYLRQGEFREYTPGDELVQSKFFLVAVSQKTSYQMDSATQTPEYGGDSGSYSRI